MTIQEFLEKLEICPIIASVQADAGNPCAEPDTLCRLAASSLQEGVQILRMQGADNIRAARIAFGVPVIGLIKSMDPASEVYITPTSAEIKELLSLGCPIIALDGTNRPRPGGESLADLVQLIHSGGALAMADCDTLQSFAHSSQAGADILSSTLAGYTQDSRGTPLPDLQLLAFAKFNVPILAEGGYEQSWQIRAALRAGCAGVVMGGALNDPIKQSRRFISASRMPKKVGAVDIGGTWLRFGVADRLGQVSEVVRIPQATRHSDRIAFIATQLEKAEIQTLGISAGGVIDPRTGTVLESKSFIPDYVGRNFELSGINVFALNDGLATAWGHACRPQSIGTRVCTIALGTGVGIGVADGLRIETDLHGNYPRLNDEQARHELTFEQVLGGLNLDRGERDQDQARAKEALVDAVAFVRRIMLPDSIVICGGVGLADWMRPAVIELGLEISPFGPEAGLVGAATLALNPPENLFG